MWAGSGKISIGIIAPPSAARSVPAKTPTVPAWSGLFPNAPTTIAAPVPTSANFLDDEDRGAERVAPVHAEDERGEQDDEQPLDHRDAEAPEHLADEDRPDRGGSGEHPLRHAELPGEDELRRGPVSDVRNMNSTSWLCAPAPYPPPRSWPPSRARSRRPRRPPWRLALVPRTARRRTTARSCSPPTARPGRRRPPARWPRPPWCGRRWLAESAGVSTVTWASRPPARVSE